MEGVGKYVTDLVFFSNHRKFKDFCARIKRCRPDDSERMMEIYKDVFSVELNALGEYIDKMYTNLEEQIKYGTKVTIITKKE